MTTTLDHASPPPRSAATMTLLSVMMFLQFFIWGAWYVTVGSFMAAHGMKDMIFWAYAVGPIAAIVSPFFLGMVADRFFASEHVLAAMNLLGAAAMVGAAVVSTSGHQLLFIILLLIHMLAYMPTLGLTNTVAFHAMTKPERQFPLVRVFGTIGWIAANWVVSKWLAADTLVIQFYVTAAAAAALGVFSFFLPHTPPPLKGQPIDVRSIFGLDSLALLKDWSFTVFILGSFLICIPLAVYYAYAQLFVGLKFAHPAYTMSYGQIFEVFFMLIMPLMFRLMGAKYMLLLGMLAWVVRYGFFAIASPMGESQLALGLIVAGILLHGICYDFFFVTGFIYTEKKASKEIRAQAQGFLVLVTQGAGMLIGTLLSGPFFNRIVVGEGQTLMHNWRTFWIAPCIWAAVVMVLFFIFFHDKQAGEIKIPSVEPAATAAA